MPENELRLQWYFLNWASQNTCDQFRYYRIRSVRFDCWRAIKSKRLSFGMWSMISERWNDLKPFFCRLQIFNGSIRCGFQTISIRKWHSVKAFQTFHQYLYSIYRRENSAWYRVDRSERYENHSLLENVYHLIYIGSFSIHVTYHWMVAFDECFLVLLFFWCAPYVHVLFKYINTCIYSVEVDKSRVLRCAKNRE